MNTLLVVKWQFVIWVLHISHRLYPTHTFFLFFFFLWQNSVFFKDKRTLMIKQQILRFSIFCTKKFTKFSDFFNSWFVNRQATRYLGQNQEKSNKYVNHFVPIRQNLQRTTSSTLSLGITLKLPNCDQNFLFLTIWLKKYQPHLFPPPHPPASVTWILRKVQNTT